MPPVNLNISETEAQAVTTRLGLTLDAEKLKVLLEGTSCDVQAGPGSGKTTVLTAKLAILADKWPHSERGICVLSHTNVARKEIERRLGKSANLRRLLSYPHFVGTFQSFVDQFLAIPYMRREGLSVVAIDNERFGARAWGIFCKYPKARFGLQNRYKSAPEFTRAIVESLHLEGAGLDITHLQTGAKGFPGPTTMTGKALIDTKLATVSEGYFRFDDMFAYAEACLAKVPYITTALRHRFPWVFVDELQDTSASQDRIVEQLFGTPASVLQRFGDKNQAIYDFDSDASLGLKLFGRRTVLPLNKTHRFGPSIAGLISNLTAVEPQVLVGADNRPALKHTIFVFPKTAIAKVVPAFADLVAQELPHTHLDAQSVCVIGSRKNEPATAHKSDTLPVSLKDYWAKFTSPASLKLSSPDSFYGFVLNARKRCLEDAAVSEGLNIIIGGTLALLRRVGGDNIPRTKSLLLKELDAKEIRHSFQELMWQFLNPATVLTDKSWPLYIKKLCQVLAINKLSSDAVEFLTWGSINPINSAKVENIYLHGASQMPIRFDSIHAVKGETHTATLVVETYQQRRHDLRDLLATIAGKIPGHKLTDAAHHNCKRIFVGMSRPSDLLCLAIRDEHFDTKLTPDLKAKGWAIVTLS